VSTPSRELCRRVVEVACRAPSVRNSQPWRWRIVGTGSIELAADRSRQLRPGEAAARNLAISCGAALHHGTLSARALGLTSEVTLMPSSSDRNLLARIRLAPGDPAPDALQTLDLIGRRRTDRRRFTTWPIPAERLGRLVQAGAGWGAFVVPVVDVATRQRTAILLDRASERVRSDRDPDPSPPEGELESPDGLLLLCTTEDEERSWLQVGQALSALWLTATSDGLSIVPLSQVIEVEETRLALRHDVLAGMAHPQLLVRVGWQEISDLLLSRTLRRPLADVLVP
jgi:hypothetical protein